MGYGYPARLPQTLDPAGNRTSRCGRVSLG
jgi:hypothetical protein